jgi:hypothetical protein
MEEEIRCGVHLYASGWLRVKNQPCGRDHTVACKFNIAVMISVGPLRSAFFVSSFCTCVNRGDIDASYFRFYVRVL